MHWYIEFMDRLIAAVGFLAAMIYVMYNGLTGWVNHIPPRAKEKMLRVITRVCLFLGLIVFFFTAGASVGSWLLLLAAWTGFLAEWVVSRMERVKRTAAGAETKIDAVAGTGARVE